MIYFVALVTGPESQVPNLYFGMERQRALAIVAMLAVAITLHVWIGPKRVAVQA